MQDINLENIIVAVVLCGVFLLLNGIFLGIIFFTRRKMGEIAQWPSTGGVVQRSYLEERSDSEGGSTSYPVVQYAYKVGANAYQGSKIAPGMEVGGMGASKVIAKYPVNALVTVYYNPANPSDAVLEKNAPALWIIWLLLIVFDLVLCCVVPFAFLASNSASFSF